MSPLRDRELHYFFLLDEQERREAILHLSESGVSDYGIAAATRLSVDMVRRILGDGSKRGASQ